MLITLKFLLSALAVLLLAPIQALALPFTVQAFAHAVTANGADTHNSGVLANTLSTHVSSGSADNFASGTASASAAPGTLGAFARAASLSSSFGGATASASARFSDTLTLVSQTLGLGDPVTLLFTLGVDGLLDGCVICPAQGNFSSSFSVAGTGSYVNNLSSVTFGQAFVGGTSNISPELIPPAIVLTTTLGGGDIGLVGSLGVFTGADGIGSVALADYSHTANFYVNVLTPGVTFSSASGANYAAPVSTVPEPASLLLLAAGLAMLAARRP